MSCSSSVSAKKPPLKRDKKHPVVPLTDVVMSLHLKIACTVSTRSKTLERTRLKKRLIKRRWLLRCMVQYNLWHVATYLSMTLKMNTHSRGHQKMKTRLAFKNSQSTQASKSSRCMTAQFSSNRVETMSHSASEKASHRLSLSLLN